jgi:ADP-heptose:LPS heptosyltransferase
MLRSFFARLRQLSRQYRRPRRIARLSQADAAALATQPPPAPSRVLVVRNDSIGDYLLYRPWLRQLSAELRPQGRHIVLVANALWAPLAQAWDGDVLAEVIPVDFSRFAHDLGYRTDTVHQFGQLAAGEVQYPQHTREPAVENFIRFLGAPVRVGRQAEPALAADPWTNLIEAGYTHRLPTSPAVLFEYDRNREFFDGWRQLFATPDPASPPATVAPLALPASVHEAGAKLAAAGPYIVLFPGASARQKRWPAQHFGQLSQALHRRYGTRYRLVVAGSPSDAEYVPAIAQAAGPGVPLDNQCGRTDLPGLAALIAGARLLISNDTVAAHLGAQAGTPSLVLLMGENYGKFFPYPPALLRAPCQCLFPPSQEARFAQGDFSPPAQDPLIATIEPGRVVAAATALLSN